MGVQNGNSKIQPARATFHLTVIGGGGPLRELPNASGQGKACRYSCIVDRGNPSREGRLCRAPWWRLTRFNAVRVHDNRVDPRAKEKPA